MWAGCGMTGWEDGSQVAGVQGRITGLSQGPRLEALEPQAVEQGPKQEALQQPHMPEDMSVSALNLGHQLGPG